MNAAGRSFVRMALYHRCRVFGIHNCFEGFADGQIHELKWEHVTGWAMQGGSKLGTQKQTPSAKNIGKIAEQLKKFGIQALLLVGGFEVNGGNELIKFLQ
jgi:6-phosphofructokinase 1